ncbi:hypothetical protein ACT3TZ_09465 [Brachybacterium sp. AOP25-B2-12]|uniref:hypothetical protein n=1 Tax=Brachybacterium sp. AOP25-B2-12 TaxID=3457710 RepID=UPI004034CBF6
MSTTSTPRPDGAHGTPAPAPSDDAVTDACGDPHDHSDHDHPPTGAEIVTGLIRGFSVLTLVVPALGLAMLIACLAATPSTPLVLFVGTVLGGLQLAVLVATSVFVSRSHARLALHPGLLTARSVLEEVLRVAAVLLALVLWPAEARGPMGLWVGAGCALVWVVLTTVQLASARQRIASPSSWSQEMVATLLLERVSVRRSMVIRAADVVGLMLFQLGATVLVAASPVMVVATIVLSVATGFSTLALQRRAPSARTGSPWAFAPLGIGLLTAALALLASLSA